MLKKGIVSVLFLMLFSFQVSAVDFNYCPITINDSSTLTADVTVTTSCVVLNNSNTFLDCNGKKISWNSAGGNGDTAVRAENVSNITIKNCILSDVNTGGAAVLGINLTNVSYSFVFNNTVHGNGTAHNYAISIGRNSNITSVENNTIRANGTGGNVYGINAENNQNNTITGNNIFVNGTSASGINDGIHLLATRNYNVTNNVIESGNEVDAQGIFLTSTNNSLIQNNTVNTTGNQSGNDGIVLIITSNNNTIRNNTVRTNGTSTDIAIAISASNNNKVFSNTLTSLSTVTGYGLQLNGGSVNTTVYNNTITITGTTSDGGATSDGISIVGADVGEFNIFENNTIIALGAGSYGINILGSSDNNFTNTILNNTAQWILNPSAGFNNFTNTTFRTGNGSIRFNGTLVFRGEHDINRSRLNISNNLAYVNTTNLTLLNTTAQINLTGLSFTTSTIRWDAGIDGQTLAECPAETCTLISYSGGNLVFDVTRFTTYTGPETPVSSSSNQGGGGGGAGGSSTSSTTSMTSQSLTTQGLRANQKVSFSVNDQQHTMTVKSVTATSVTVTVASVPQTVVLNKGDVREISLDDDLVPDFRITVLDLYRAKATFKLEKLLSPPKAQTPVSTNTPSIPTSKPAVAPANPVSALIPAVAPAPYTPPAQRDLMFPPAKKSSGMWLPVVLIIVLVIASFTMLKGRIKKTRH